MWKLLLVAIISFLFFGKAVNSQAESISEKISKITLSDVKINMKRAEARNILKKKGGSPAA